MSTNALTRIDFNNEQLEVIKKQFLPPNTSDAEVAYCFAVARELGLNPITKEIFFVPRRQKNDKGQWVERVEPLVSRDGLLSLAHRTGALAGMETKVEVKDIPAFVNGAWTSKPDLVATTTIWARGCDRPFVVSAAYSEYVQLTSDGQPTKFWREKKITMISKVSESQALRRVANISGVYSPEECQMGVVSDSGDLILEPEAIDAEYSRPEPEKPRLSAVPTRQPETVPEPSPAFTEEDDWPVSTPPDQKQPVPQQQPTDDGIVSEIVGLLEGKGIQYEIDPEAGFISAKSYNHKELLKASGFKWSPELKSWIFRFEPEPF